MSWSVKLLFTTCVACVLLINSCGGGADIGNPGNTIMASLSGTVKGPDSEAPGGARVIIGRYCELPVDAKGIDTAYENGIVIVVNNKLFDTTYCDNYGRFVFRDLTPGEYTVYASLGKYGRIAPVTLDSGENETGIELAELANMTVRLYSNLDTTKVYLKSARITGTPFTAVADSNGTFRFDSVPSGFGAITFFKSDKNLLTLDGLVVEPAENAAIVADPQRDISYWTIRTAYHEWNARPFVERYGVWKDSILTPDSSSYDLFVQFSHPMDTYITSGALHCSSVNGNVKIDKMFWHGSDLLLLRLCMQGDSGVCMGTLSDVQTDITVTVDTTSVSTYGIRMVSPEILRF